MALKITMVTQAVGRPATKVGVPPFLTAPSKGGPVNSPSFPPGVSMPGGPNTLNVPLEMIKTLSATPSSSFAIPLKTQGVPI